jgi:hypothetical protein
MRCEQHRCAVLRDDALKEKSPKFRRGQWIEASSRFVKQQNRRGMKHRARQPQAVNVPCGKRAHLAIQERAQAQQIRKVRDPPGGFCAREIIQQRKQFEVFAPAEPRVKTRIRAGVVSKPPANLCGLASYVETAYFGSPARGKQQGRQDAQQRGFSCAVGAHQGQHFSWLYVEGNSKQCRYGEVRKGIQQSPPSCCGRRKIFFQVFNVQREVAHHTCRYILSLGRRQDPSLHTQHTRQRIAVAVAYRSRYNFARWLQARFWGWHGSDTTGHASPRAFQIFEIAGKRKTAMSATISEHTVVVAAKDQVSCDLAGEAAILNIKNGVYYGLDPVGARIWNLVQQPRSVLEIQRTIVGEYDVEPERCSRDLLDLLEKLFSEGLIEVKDGSTA